MVVFQIHVASADELDDDDDDDSVDVVVSSTDTLIDDVSSDADVVVVAVAVAVAVATVVSAEMVVSALLLHRFAILGPELVAAEKTGAARARKREV